MDLYMFIFTLSFLGITIYGICKRKEKSIVGITDKRQSMMIRAICCIVVILVHIPKEHGNIIQDVIGSFGYIAVTLFFMLSAYGLKYSVENKKDYLKNFCKNRLLSILIPLWLVNTIGVIVTPSEAIQTNILRIIGISNISFITILIGYYILFWIIYKFIKNEQIRDYILCLIVFIYSLLGKILNLAVGWQVETIGFIYGILLYHFAEKINKGKVKYIALAGLNSLILGILYIKYKDVYIIGTWILRVALSMNLIVLLSLILNKIKIGNRVQEYIGSISYEIYLMHTIIITLLSPLDVSSGLWIILTILITILSASIINFIDKKIIKLIKITNDKV